MYRYRKGHWREFSDFVPSRHGAGGVVSRINTAASLHRTVAHGCLRRAGLVMVGSCRPKADNGNEDQFKSSIVVIKFCLLGALKRLALWRQDKNEKPTNKRKSALCPVKHRKYSTHCEKL